MNKRRGNLPPEASSLRYERTTLFPRCRSGLLSYAQPPLPGRQLTASRGCASMLRNDSQKGKCGCRRSDRRGGATDVVEVEIVDARRATVWSLITVTAWAETTDHTGGNK